MALGRNEALHITCGYVGKESACPNSCSKCAISIKRDGDAMVSAKRYQEAVKIYKKAVFLEPKYADAWCSLANAYLMISEFNNAIIAFNKALGIDPRYGLAMFGKAISLYKQGKLNEALGLVLIIQELYEDDKVDKLKSELIRNGAKDTSGIMSISDALNSIKNNAKRVIRDNNLLEKDGVIRLIKGLDNKEAFSESIFTFCRKNYHSLGLEKIWSESILNAFYAAIIITLKYYQTPDITKEKSVFSYLSDHVNLEKLEYNAEKILKIEGNSNQSEKIWNIIYQFVKYSLRVLSSLESDTDSDCVVLCSIENAYVIGMLLAMRVHEQQLLNTSRSPLNAALEKLAESTNDYHYTPVERSAMCYSIALPKMVPLHFKCDGCGEYTSISVCEETDDGFRPGEEQKIIDKYKSLANEFTRLGYPTVFKCFCKKCAKEYYPADESYKTNNFVFVLSRPDCTIPVCSFPQTGRYNGLPYRVTLAFLKGADTIEKIAKTTHTEYSGEEYLKMIHSVLGDSVTGLGDHII